MRGGDRAGERIPSSPQSEAAPEPESPQVILARDMRRTKALALAALAEMPEAGWPSGAPDGLALL